MGFRSRLEGPTLLQSFALTGGAVMVVAMLVIGTWVTSTIQARVVENTAAATALFMDSFIAPLAQELDQADTLSIGPTRAIEELLSGSELGRRVLSVKIWKPGGLVAYAANPELIGRRFAETEGLREAFAGRLRAELDDLGEAESSAERQSGIPLLEVYSPIRQAWSGRVIAVAEFYENATELDEALAGVLRESWAIVAAVTALIGVALIGIVARGSAVIKEQRDALEARIAEAQSMSEESRQLRIRAERASSRLAELNESFLGRISAELHDGPAQLIGLAALRLPSVASAQRPEERSRELAIVENALAEAIREIRNLSKGLTLPEIEGAPLARTIERVVRAHEIRTGTSVALDLNVDGTVPHAVAISAFRFVQEGLNNAFRHAGGAGQRVKAEIAEDILSVTVSNAPAEPQSAPPAGTTPRGLGLPGLRERVESLGGTFQFGVDGARGAEMTMRIKVDAEAFHA